VLCCVHLYTDGNRVTTLSFVVRRAVISIVHMYLLILYDRLATVAGLYCDVCYWCQWSVSITAVTRRCMQLLTWVFWPVS